MAQTVLQHLAIKIAGNATCMDVSHTPSTDKNEYACIQANILNWSVWLQMQRLVVPNCTPLQAFLVASGYRKSRNHTVITSFESVYPLWQQLARMQHQRIHKDTVWQAFDGLVKMGVFQCSSDVYAPLAIYAFMPSE